MPRPTGVFKEPPAMLPARLGRRYNRPSKAAWIDLYADLYRQTHGDDATADQIMNDAEKRLKILEDNRIRGPRRITAEDAANDSDEYLAHN